MDPFAPGEIPVMVLRYLAANNCAGAAMKLIEEMPRLRDFIPAKPNNVPDIQYLKHVMRTMKGDGLKDVLWDYGNSKLLVEEMLEDSDNIDMMSSRSSEPLQDKLKTVQSMIKEGGKPVASTLQNATVTSPRVITVDVSTNTSDYKCLACSSRQQKVTSDASCQTAIVKRESSCQTVPFVKSDFACQALLPSVDVPAGSCKIDSSCQTEEYTAVELGLQKEIPILFYKTLLTDDNLQDKIAQTINKHINNEDNEESDAIQKIPSKAGTEFDEFIEDFLQDIPDDCVSQQSNDGMSQKLHDPGSLEEIENNLTSMFYGTDENALAASQNHLNAPITLSEAEAPIATLSPSSKSMETSAQSEPEVRGIDHLIHPQQGNPKVYQRIQSVKRITPTPLHKTNVNPVFNAAVVVEKHTIDLGDKTTQVSVVTMNAERPTWEKIHRRSIAPKIPRSPKITTNLTVRRRESHSTPEFFAPKADLNDSNNKSMAAGSSKKRKGTPLKLTPEKAKQLDSNFILVRSDTIENSTTAKVSASEQCDSSIKKTPAASSAAANRVENPAIGNVVQLSLSENSSHDVTPMQPPPPAEPMSTSSLKVMSPNALQRLIASANKVCGNTTSVTANYFNKKKSFSTPGKRKHVRSLTFGTPPSLKNLPDKNALISSGPETSLKRKAEDDLNFNNFKSKKRLNWPESEKKKPTKTSESKSDSSKSCPGSVTQDRGAVKTISKGPGTEEQSQNQSSSNDTNDKVAPSSFHQSNPQNMSTILEESISNADLHPGKQVDESNSCSNEAVPVASSSTIPTQLVYVNLSNKGESSLSVYSEQVSLPDGTTAISYFQIDPVTNTRIPIPVLNGPNESFPGQELQTKFSQNTGPITLNYSNEEDPEASSISVLSSSQLLKRASIIQSTQSKRTVNGSSPSITSPREVQPATLQSGKSDPPTLKANVKGPERTAIPVLEIHEADNTTSTQDAYNEYMAHINAAVAKTNREQETQLQMPVPTPKETPPVPKPVEKGRRRRASQSKKVAEKEKLSSVESSRRGGRSRGKKKTPPPSPKLIERVVIEKSEDEQEKISKRGRGRGKSGSRKSVKPKVTLKLKALFGDSPLSKPTACGKDDEKSKDMEVVAGPIPVAPTQGTRKSPRKRANPGQLEAEQTPFKGITNQSVRTCNNQKNVVHSTEETVRDKSGTRLCPSLQVAPQQQEPVVFNIVPAPLGFPEPTPIKNFGQTWFLNISELTCNTGPLITPFKANGPSGDLNITHFTLPPTPRVVVDDTDSNSAQSLKLNFEGLYPTNLLTSTPFKQGVPRTPGRRSSSSNSQSPIQPGKVAVITSTKAAPPNTVQEGRHNNLPQLVIGRPTPIKTPAARMPLLQRISTHPLTPRSATVAADLDMSDSPEKDKSDGELSSSDEEDNSKKESNAEQPSMKNPPLAHNVRQSAPERRLEPAPSPIIPVASNNRVTQLRHLPPPKPTNPLPPHISVTLSPNIDRTKGIHFQVGRSREPRFLTMSKEETAIYSLVNFSSLDRKADRRQEKPHQPIPKSVKPSRSVVPIIHKPPNENIKEGRPPAQPVMAKPSGLHLYSLVQKAKQKSKDLDTSKKS